MCNGRSTWAVMSEHEDFADGKNPSVAETVSKDVTPTFKYVVQRSKEIVFVIDVSTRDKVGIWNCASKLLAFEYLHLTSVLLKVCSHAWCWIATVLAYLNFCQ